MKYRNVNLNFCSVKRIRCYDPAKTAFRFMLTTPWLTIKKWKLNFQSQTTAKVLNRSQCMGTRIVIGYNVLLLPCRSYQCLLIKEAYYRTNSQNCFKPWPSSHHFGRHGIGKQFQSKSGSFSVWLPCLKLLCFNPLSPNSD